MIGLVLAGGGARGAYEAGVLAELLPWLEARGERPTVLVGTSVGAISAAHLAATAHLSAEDSVAGLLDRWGQVAQAKVIRPIITRTGPGTVLEYAGEVLGLPGVRLTGLLDPTPLRATLESWLDWDAPAAAVRDGHLDAFAVVATSAATDRATIFLDSAGEVVEAEPFDWVPTSIDVDHVLASAAIPVVFPAHHVHAPREAAGWYFDGGTRLNAPIRPALDLGCDKVVVVATHLAARPRDGGDRSGRQPDFAAGALELIQATLVDPLIKDAVTLKLVNELVQAAPEGATRFRVIEHLFAGPRTSTALGDLVREVLEGPLGGPLGALRAPDVALLVRLLGGTSRANAELLSYLLFHPAFIEPAIALGREDARALLDAKGAGAWET